MSGTALASVAVDGAPPKVSEARERLLRVASELFYREGIHGIGMDRVLAEAGVTRATMYRHFTGKEALVAAYLEREDALIRAALTPAALGDRSGGEVQTGARPTAVGDAQDPTRPGGTAQTGTRPAAVGDPRDAASPGGTAQTDARSTGPGDAQDAAGSGGAARVARVVDAIADDIERQHTRGCPFINAAAEYPDAASPVRVIIARHRAWFRGLLRDALAGAGVADPPAAADALVLLRDAALVGAYLDGVEVARPAFLATARAVTGL